MMGEFFGNITLESVFTTCIVAIFGCVTKMINDESKVGTILFWITAFFAGVAGISFIVFVWLITVFGGHHTCFI